MLEDEEEELILVELVVVLVVDGVRQRARVVGQQWRWFVRDVVDVAGDEHRTWRTLFLMVTRWMVSASKT